MKCNPEAHNSYGKLLEESVDLS